MILRRISERLRARDWSTVTIEFVIVVAGIFIGLELSNWNDDRKLALQEQSYLALLREEILDNMEAIDYQARYTETVVAAGQPALDWLDGGGGCEDDCADLLIDFFHASQVWGTGYLSARFRELERLGFPSDPGVREAVQAFYLWLDGWDAVNDFTPAYRETVRSHIAPQAFIYLWSDCHALASGQLEVLTRECVDALRALDTPSMLRNIHADAALRPQLRFWLGQNIFAATTYSDMHATGATAIASITEHLDSSHP